MVQSYEELEKFEIDPFFYANKLYKRKKYSESLNICNQILTKNHDEAVWLLKCIILFEQGFIDDLEIETQEQADELFRQNVTNELARPGTSTFNLKMNSNNLAMRPTTKGGRPSTGLQRPGTVRPLTGQVSKNVITRAGTASGRPMTSNGRLVRLNTASIQNLSSDEKFIDVDKMDIKKIAEKSQTAMAVMNYLLQIEQNPKWALKLAKEATLRNKKQNQWWTVQLGIANFKLNFLSEALGEFEECIKIQESPQLYLWKAKVQMKMDKPNNSIFTLQSGLEKYPQDIAILTHLARAYDLLGDENTCYENYKKVIDVEMSNIEAIAYVSNLNFQRDQYEVSLKLQNRLLLSGNETWEVYCNIGISSFYSNQQDLSIQAQMRALRLAKNKERADIWYNISFVALTIGDLKFTQQCLKMAIMCDYTHFESLTNLGVLEQKRGNFNEAIMQLEKALSQNDLSFESLYNLALVYQKKNNFSKSQDQISKSLEIQPDHKEADDLFKTLHHLFKHM